MKKSYLIALAAVVIVFSNWKTIDKDSMIKDVFYKNNYQSRLEQNVNDKVKISWLPAWSKGSYEELKGRNIYACIPLLPQLKDLRGNNVESKFEIPNTSRYLVVEKNGETLHFSIRTFIGENHDMITSRTALQNFTGTVLVKGMDDNSNKLQRYCNGSVSMVSSDQICVYWTVCTWHGSGAAWCTPYVTTTSLRSEIPYAYPCTYPGSADCSYFPAGSHVEQYCE